MSVNILLWLAGILYIFACLFLVLVVLLQEGKTGGMGGAESAGQAPGALTETFGAGGAQRGLFKVTSWTAGIFFVLTLTLTILGNKKEEAGGAIDLGTGPVATEAAPGTTVDVPVTPAEVPAGGTSEAPPADAQ